MTHKDVYIFFSYTVRDFITVVVHKILHKLYIYIYIQMSDYKSNQSFRSIRKKNCEFSVQIIQSAKAPEVNANDNGEIDVTLLFLYQRLRSTTEVFFFACKCV